MEEFLSKASQLFHAEQNHLIPTSSLRQMLEKTWVSHADIIGDKRDGLRSYVIRSIFDTESEKIPRFLTGDELSNLFAKRLDVMAMNK
ncbi:hypothetical protein HDU76_012519 [Blyttiomyces sp. JEL0837]|nr:hypothetical protein HDU76_012519 [Blyttiomyces sp. JEL0837]